MIKPMNFADIPVRRRRSPARTALLFLLLGIVAGGLFYFFVDLPLLRQQRAVAGPRVDIAQTRGKRIDGGDGTQSVGPAVLSDPSGSKREDRGGSADAAGAASSPRPAGPVDTNSIGDVILTPDKAAAFKEFDAWSGAPGEYRPVSFGVLASFEYDPLRVVDALQRDPKAPLPRQVPDKIAALDGTRAEVRGFMLPTRVENRRVREFLLVKNRLLCCYGAAVSTNDWIHVVVKPDVEVEPIQDVIVTVKGELHVGEAIEDGVVMSLYRCSADSVSYNTGF